MTRGKKTCKILKEIRRQIAAKNDIEYLTSECSFQGECKGTCPKCEAEVRYLENELRKRQQLGKAVAIAGISLGVAGTFAACGNSQTSHETSSDDTVHIVDTQKVIIENVADTTSIDSVSPECNVIKEQLIPPPPVPGMIEIEGIFDPIDIDPILPDSTAEVEPIIVRFPEIRAQPPGGMAALMKFIQENIIYPEDAANENISGTVIVEFVVKVDGSIDNVKVIKKVHPILDAEAVRVVEQMEKWTPAKNNNEVVASYFQLPVQFKLPKDKILNTHDTDSTRK